MALDLSDTKQKRNMLAFFKKTSTQKSLFLILFFTIYRKENIFQYFGVLIVLFILYRLPDCQDVAR